MPEIDLDHDGSLDAAEFAAARDRVVSTFVKGLAVTAGGAACPGTLDNAHVLDAENGVAIASHYTCAKPPERLTLTWSFLDALSASHRHIARLVGAGPIRTNVASRGNASWTIDVDARASPSGGIALSMSKLGILHILTGLDHLAFLLGLVLIGGTVRSLAVVVTAFTVAHSITLALAALGIFAPDPRIVEPLIALSIAYVGVENFFVKDATKRWKITFPFGLVHGFGFASALREIALSRSQIPVALVSFNLGVEAGQLAVLALVLPVVLAARRSPQFGDRGVRLVSSVLALAGVLLFFVRVAARS